jgi:hypothetical protein
MTSTSDTMARRLARTLLLASMAPLSGACAPEEQEPLGVAEQAAFTANALTANALTANALTANALTANALTANALGAAALAAVEDPGPPGDLARELLRYEVSCAFGADQRFDFSWTDTAGSLHVESYPGSLGLARAWATGALDLAGQEWVSACLAARVNAVGVSVPLSVRGTHPALATTPAELAAYPTREGAFFGNLFADNSVVYACYDPLTTTAAQLSRRMCAQPRLLSLTLGGLSTAYDCGPIQVVGPCAVLPGGLRLGPCASEAPIARYLYGCSPPASRGATPSITTFLQGGLL